VVRIGQEKQVTVIRYVVKDSVEMVCLIAMHGRVYELTDIEANPGIPATQDELGRWRLRRESREHAAERGCTLDSEFFFERFRQV
jgi:hypothetical protein